MSTQPDHSPPDLLYGLDDLPPLGRTTLYGLQWLILFLPVLTVLSVLSADVLGLENSARVAFFQRLVLVTGATMVVQTLWGHRMPLLDGPSMALVITLASLAPAGMPAIGGGMILGGFLIFLCGLLGLARHLTPLFTDRVVGVILLLIGLTVLPYVLPMILGVDLDHPQGRPLVLGLSLALAAVMSAMFHYFKGLWQSLSLFFGVALGTCLFALFGLVDLSGVATAPWLSAPDPAWGPWPKLNPASAISFTLAYLAVLVNAAGSLYSLQPVVGSDRMEDRTRRGLIWTGLSGLAAGAAGVVGTVPYSLSPGVITVTRVGSRFAVTTAGFALLSMGFLGKVTAVLSAVPEAVVGSALLVSMAASVGVSLNIIGRRGRLTGRDYLVVGLPVLLGTSASIMPAGFLDQLPDVLRPLTANGLIVGVVTVLFLEHGLLRGKKK
ncbi:MAG: solute carrier family 23 protein [Thermodesulfobacteriota bacterium]